MKITINHVYIVGIIAIAILFITAGEVDKIRAIEETKQVAMQLELEKIKGETEE